MPHLGRVGPVLYRLRVFSGEHLLATIQGEPTGLGQQLAELINEYTDPEPDAESPEIRWVVRRLDEAGEEQAVAPKEDREMFAAMAERSEQIAKHRMGACQRCGRPEGEHEGQLYPIQATPKGPIYFECWTKDERDELLPSDWPA